MRIEPRQARRMVTLTLLLTLAAGCAANGTDVQPTFENLGQVPCPVKSNMPTSLQGYLEFIRTETFTAGATPSPGVIVAGEGTNWYELHRESQESTTAILIRIHDMTEKALAYQLEKDNRAARVSGYTVPDNGNLLNGKSRCIVFVNTVEALTQ